jgi:hypothetical protein
MGKYDDLGRSQAASAKDEDARRQRFSELTNAAAERARPVFESELRDVASALKAAGVKHIPLRSAKFIPPKLWRLEIINRPGDEWDTYWNVDTKGRLRDYDKLHAPLRAAMPYIGPGEIGRWLTSSGDGLLDRYIPTNVGGLHLWKGELVVGPGAMYTQNETSMIPLETALRNAISKVISGR